MELIKTKQKTLSYLNEKIMEIIDEEEDLNEEIEEVDRYELEINLESRKLRSTSKKRNGSISGIVRKPINTTNTQQTSMFCQTKHYSRPQDISSLCKAIKKEICIQEAANANPIETDIIPTASFVTETTNKRWRSTGSKDSNDNSTFKTKRPCLFCQTPHHPNECTKITNINVHTKIVKDK
ncbi:unnamed protein product [Mytilus coruscus]|uniref:Uncharacterized protein n=1 Tax=Mytilus coruscus TaxID=42192 RepID=A0A6J8ABS4_MYTCO|nr:unnamed protein product [Mytilus coruscus]